MRRESLLSFLVSSKCGSHDSERKAVQNDGGLGLEWDHDGYGVSLQVWGEIIRGLSQAVTMTYIRL